MSPLDAERQVAVVVARGGRLPHGADEAVAEAGGMAVVVGSGAEDAADQLVSGVQVWWSETGAGLQPGALAAGLAPLLRAVPLVVMPSSPDGRDLAPRLAAILDRPLIAHSVAVHTVTDEGDRVVGVRAQVSRLDDRVLVPVAVDGPAIATLVPGSRTVVAVPPAGRPEPLTLPLPSIVHEPIVLDVLEPDPETMDLADAARVVSGGAGLATGLADEQARDVFDLLVRVAGAVDASAGATRVATDAGWIGYERQIGTTGVTVQPELYIAFGVSGAIQHVGGVGTPRHIVSVNIDPSCPMTAMADLGLVTDARGLLLELARRFALGDLGQVDRRDRVESMTKLPATNEVGHG